MSGFSYQIAIIRGINIIKTKVQIIAPEAISMTINGKIATFN